MFKTEFSSNPNGKLFMEHFNDVRVYNELRHAMGAEHEIWLRGHFMGTATIVARYNIRYSQIRDVLGFTILGRPAYYLAGTLKQWYGKEAVENSELAHLVFHWTKRNMSVQDALIKDFWTDVQQQHRYEQAVQQTLGI